jgi:hypothetical protein
MIRCTMQEGATVKCGGKNCTQHVHPLCARNSGGYLTTRDVGGRIVHRTFCQVPLSSSTHLAMSQRPQQNVSYCCASCHTACYKSQLALTRQSTRSTSLNDCRSTFHLVWLAGACRGSPPARPDRAGGVLLNINCMPEMKCHLSKCL